MANADQIRMHARERYVLPAHERKQKRFSINAGDVVRELRLAGRAPAVCSALKTRRFLERNDLRLVGASGPKSGQSTTVTYTYEFVKGDRSSPEHDGSWKKLRGTLKDVFAELGGGEAYLRAERSMFYSPEEGG
ncbi:MAG TPA: hypothetical protein VEO19_14400 [Terriglobia bacterium]|nr:hypothetical protein [Terriglobia bacterium]